MATPTTIAAYLALFTCVGLLFLLVNLLIGRLVRPSNWYGEKQEIYECGEPTIGSSFVQFDLRFYVVALVFIVFDVEVAFLFPLATVYGKATNLRHDAVEMIGQSTQQQAELSEDTRGVLRELGVPQRALTQLANDPTTAGTELRSASRRVAQAAFWAINVFFLVLLVGFAYEWKTGAFDWVRAVSHERRERVMSAVPDVLLEQQTGLTRV